MNISESASRPTLAPDALAYNRRTRREPSPAQYDYLHLRRLLDDLEPALAGIAPSGGTVLDVFCGSRPYDDLFPPAVRVIGLDIDDYYGVADIASTEWLPGEDAAYDAVTCIEGFHYVREPEHAVSELRRVIKPGGRVLVSLPLVWEYDRETMERRFTGPELQALFADWEDVKVVENGGRSVAWTLLTGSMLRASERYLKLALPDRLVAAAFRALYVGLNGLGILLEAIERPRRNPRIGLPPNLMLTARRPA